MTLRKVWTSALVVLFVAGTAVAGPKKASDQAKKDAAHHAERGNASAAKAAADRVKSRERAEKTKERNDASKAAKKKK